MKLKKMYFILACLLLFNLTNCIKKTQEYQLYRFVDHLKEENVLETPFKNLNQKFDKYEQKLEKNWIYFSKLSKNQKCEIWGISTKFPVLGLEDSEKPVGMRLLRNGKELEFLENSRVKPYRWKWLKTEKELSLKLELKRGELPINYIFRKDMILPSGEVMFEIIAKSKDPKKYLPHLKINLDNQTIGKIIIGKHESYESYKVFKKVNLGEHKLGLTFSEVTQISQEENKDMRLLLDRIKIRGLNDILILYLPQKKIKALPKGVYELSYYAEPTSKITKGEHSGLDIKNPFLKSLFYLYKIKHKRDFILHDLGTGKNPFQIKRKLKINSQSMNVLSAPARSEFVFNLKIPKEAVLEFGCGIIPTFKKGR